MKRALITGVSGQDGSYLAELLLEKGYEVHGIVRRSSLFNRGRIEHLLTDPAYKGRMQIHYGDVTDSLNISRLIDSLLPDEVYNLAAQSHVAISFETPEYTAQVDAVGALRLLESIRSKSDQKEIRFYQASTSEMFGKVAETPQRETTPFHPRSPYGVAKVYAHWVTVNYREAYGLHASSGILFNHESPRRGENFVTRKITLSLAKIMAGQQESIHLGNLNALRDWGYAKDYVEGMWRMVQQEEPGDYVLATGVQKTVREFVNAAFAAAGRRIEWHGKGPEEKGIDPDTGKALVVVDPRYYRPAEVETLVGDPSLAQSKLGWKAHTSFEDLVCMMVEADMALFGVTA